MSVWEGGGVREREATQHSSLQSTASSSSNQRNYLKKYADQHYSERLPKQTRAHTKLFSSLKDFSQVSSFSSDNPCPSQSGRSVPAEDLSWAIRQANRQAGRQRPAAAAAAAAEKQAASHISGQHATPQ
eukprot:11360247-Prorocentrum_lima.AAC.1